MDVRHPRSLPIACAGLSLRKPWLLLGLISTNLALWVAMGLLLRQLI